MVIFEHYVCQKSRFLTVFYFFFDFVRISWVLFYRIEKSTFRCIQYTTVKFITCKFEIFCKKMPPRFSLSAGTPHFLLTWILCQLSQLFPACLGVPALCVQPPIESWYFYPPQEIHPCMSWGSFGHLNIYLNGLQKLGFKNTLSYTVSPVRWDSCFQANWVENQKLN